MTINKGVKSMSKQCYKEKLETLDKHKLRIMHMSLGQTLEKLVHEGRKYKATGNEAAYERNLGSRGIVTFKLDAIETELYRREELGR